MTRAGTEHAQAAAGELRQAAEMLNGLGLYLRYETGAPSNRASDGGLWIEEEALAAPEDEPQASLLAALCVRGFGGNRRAASASLMLRYGWAAGFPIGTYLGLGRAPLAARYGLGFTPTMLLGAVAVRQASFLSGDRTGLRSALAETLHAHAEPIVETHHVWSGFSRKALWAMVVSSWAAQFVQIGEKLSGSDYGLDEAEAVLSLHPIVRAAAPDLYVVRAEGRRGVCQMRRLCCLWFKAPAKQFCASCPIIPEAERLARNRSWIAERGVPEDAGPGRNSDARGGFHAM